MPDHDPNPTNGGLKGSLSVGEEHPPVGTEHVALPGVAGSKPRRARLAVMGVGVVAVLAVGLFAYRGFSGESGGAKSPDAAVRQLVDAVNAEDPVGAANVLAPSEVRTLGDLLKTTEDRAQGSGMAPESDPSSGFAVDVEDLELDVGELSDTVARVAIDDVDVSWSVTPRDMSERARTLAHRAESGSFDQDDLVYENEGYDDYVGYGEPEGEYREVEIDPFLIAVKRGGGWYVSPTYTAAAYLAEVDGLPDGDFDEERPDDLPAQESPEEAVVELMNTLEDKDPETTFASLPSDEWSVLWVYRDAVDELIDDATEDGQDFAFDVDDQDLAVSGLPGGLKKVTISGASGSLRTTDEYGDQSDHDWDLDRWCLTWSGNDRGEECLDQGSRLWERSFDSFDIQDPFVVVQQDRGGWVVSPAATLVEYGKAIVAKVSDEMIYRALGAGTSAPADGTTAVGQPVTGKLNDAGYAVYDLELERGDRLAVAGVDDDLELEIFDPDGDESYDVAHYAEAEEAGTYRLAVFGDPGSSYDLSLGDIPVEPLPDDLVARGTVSEDQPVSEYVFQVQEPGTWNLSTENDDYSSLDNYSFWLLDDDHQRMGCGDVCELDAGVDYTIQVSQWGTGSEDFEVTLEPAAALSIDGGTSTSGYLDSDEYDYLEVEVPAGVTAEVSLSALEDFDLYCEGAPGCSSSESSGGYEDITITGPYSGDVAAYAYSGSGRYDVEIFEY